MASARQHISFSPMTPNTQATSATRLAAAEPYDEATENTGELKLVVADLRATIAHLKVHIRAIQAREAPDKLELATLRAKTAEHIAFDHQRVRFIAEITRLQADFDALFEKGTNLCSDVLKKLALPALGVELDFAETQEVSVLLQVRIFNMCCRCKKNN